MNDHDWQTLLLNLDEHGRELARSVVRRMSWIIDRTIEGRISGNTDAVGEAYRQLGNLSNRVHTAEDQIAEMQQALAALALELSSRSRECGGQDDDSD